jgi:hypothetical protein
VKSLILQSPLVSHAFLIGEFLSKNSNLVS